MEQPSSSLYPYEKIHLLHEPRKKRVLIALDTSSHFQRTLLESALQFVQEIQLWQIQIAEPGDLNPGLIHGFEPDGLLCSPLNLEQLHHIEASAIPFINTTENTLRSKGPLLRLDDYDLGAIAADFLHQRNPKHLIYCGTNPQREASFFERCLDQELTKDKLSPWSGDIDESFFEHLKTLPKPLAIYAENDRLGQHLIQRLTEQGLEVPQQAIVLGTGNDPLFCNACCPPLSSVSLKSANAGYEAAQMLHHWMDGSPPDWQQKLIAPAHVTERGSSSIHSEVDPRIARAMQYYLNHMENGHNVEEVSRRSELSYRSFHRLFKQQLNCAPKSWMEQEQFKRARSLLENSNLKLAEVALRCGYSDDKSLIRAFRRLGRKTPASYRKASPSS
jgi:LacI family transcriptional regulator